MKYKIFLFAGLPVLFFLLSAGAAVANEINPEPLKLESLKTKADFEQAYDILKSRVSDLKTQKRAAVTKDQKDQLKMEINNTKDDIKAVKAKALNGGIYIGSGVLVLLIVLLLIL